MTRRLLAPFLSCALVVGFMALASSADAAGPSTPECLAANAKAARLLTEHRGREARDQLLVCAAESCPADVRDECAHRVAEANASVATVVFELKDEAGNDVAGVKIGEDGKLLDGRVEGAAIELDPGEHTFTFAAPGYVLVEKKLVVVEGVKDRRERVVLSTGAPRPAPPAAPPPKESPAAPAPSATASGPAEHKSSSRRTWSFVTLGLGTAIAAGGVTLALVEQGKLPGAEANLNNWNQQWVRGGGGMCDQSTLVLPTTQANCITMLNNANNQVNDTQAYRTVGWVAAGVGGAAMIAGVVLLFTGGESKGDEGPPKGEHAIGGWQWQLVPVVAPHVASVSAIGRF